MGARVLLVDIDPQGNASSGLGVVDRETIPTTYDVMIRGLPAFRAIRCPNGQPRLELLPANRDLVGAEVELVDVRGRETILRETLAPVAGNYDFVLMDCPPSLGLLTLNTLAAADSVLIPIQCEFYALEGLSQLLGTVQLVQRSLNPGLTIEGVLLTMYDQRLSLSRQVAIEARRYFGELVFDTVIPRNVSIAEAPSFGKPVADYAPASAGARRYADLARGNRGKQERLNQWNPPGKQGAGSTMSRSDRLGRGLSALLGEYAGGTPTAVGNPAPPAKLPGARNRPQPVFSRAGTFGRTTWRGSRPRSRSTG